MVHSRSLQLDETFFALSDPTRREMLSRMAGGEMTVAELADPFEMSAPAISKHLRVLEKAGLLEQQKDGRIRRCRLIAAPLKDAAQWVEQYRQFWEDRLDSLDQYLAEIQSTDTPSKKSKTQKPNKKKKS
ncbi:ArsR/SmtB family transcription factor [Bremerella volcania]|nr:metalloregulator ArsR/SmtB family transcription factor [Bremerella volcania]